MRVLAACAILAGLAGVFGLVVASHAEPSALRPLAAAYVRASVEDLTTPNVITGILMAYRSFDTLGEVAVLYMVAASLGLLLQPIGDHGGGSTEPRLHPGEIVESGKQVLFPMIMTFGAYVIANGHLSAGGGFQGGAILASGVMLLMIANPDAAINVAALGLLESAVGVLFVAIGILGMIYAGGFLDPRILPAGTLGAFVSAGAIPLTSALLGIKVGAELSVIIQKFRS